MRNLFLATLIGAASIFALAPSASAGGDGDAFVFGFKLDGEHFFVSLGDSGGRRAYRAHHTVGGGVRILAQRSLQGLLLMGPGGRDVELVQQELDVLPEVDPIAPGGVRAEVPFIEQVSGELFDDGEVVWLGITHLHRCLF